MLSRLRTVSGGLLRVGLVLLVWAVEALGKVSAHAEVGAHLVVLACLSPWFFVTADCPDL